MPVESNSSTLYLHLTKFVRSILVLTFHLNGLLNHWHIFPNKLQLHDRRSVGINFLVPRYVTFSLPHPLLQTSLTLCFYVLAVLKLNFTGNKATSFYDSAKRTRQQTRDSIRKSPFVRWQLLASCDVTARIKGDLFPYCVNLNRTDLSDTSTNPGDPSL